MHSPTRSKGRFRQIYLLIYGTRRVAIANMAIGTRDFLNDMAHLISIRASKRLSLRKRRERRCVNQSCQCNMKLISALRLPTRNPIPEILRRRGGVHNLPFPSSMPLPPPLKSCSSHSSGKESNQKRALWRLVDPDSRHISMCGSEPTKKSSQHSETRCFSEPSATYIPVLETLQLLVCTAYYTRSLKRP